MGYIKQLDGLRAIAVLLVLIWHWIPRTYIMNKLVPGPLGVDLFFVLSGFLITQILLDNRNQAEMKDASKKQLLTNFYARRVLRIFPIYYVTITVTILLRNWLSLGMTPGEVLSNITYTSNFYIYWKQAWPQATPHFWSLAVEEQFYLLWPLLMIFIRRPFVRPVIIGFIAIGFLSQTFLPFTEFNVLLPTSCFDCLGTGALLAWYTVYRPEWLNRIHHIAFLLAIVTAMIFVLSSAGIFPIRQIRSLHASWGAWIIAYIIKSGDKKTMLMSLLGNRILVNVGRVSYGIYLYHVLYIYAASVLWYRYVQSYLAPLEPPVQFLIFIAVNLVVLLLLCFLSWKFIEQPVLSLKKKFRYQGQTAAQRGVMPKEALL